MNTRAEIPPVPVIAMPSGKVVSLPVAMHRRLADCTLVPLADGVSALFFDMMPGGSGAAGRLVARVDDTTLPAPVLTTRLALRSGGERHLLLAGRTVGTLLKRHIRLSLADRVVAAIDPGWLQSPIGDAAALIEGLSDDGRRRLLKLFLTTGSSLFGPRAGAAFGTAARRLLVLLGVQPLKPSTVCALGAGCIISFRLPGPIDPERMGEIVALDGARAQRLPDCRLVAERGDRTCLLHLHLPRMPAPGSTLVGLGAVPIQLRLPDIGMQLRPLLPWLDQRDARARAWTHDIVESVAPTDPAAAALMRELRHRDRATPTLAVRHLSATPRGVLFALDLEDGEDLVRHIRLERGEAQVVIPVPSARLRGYVVLPRYSAIADGYRMRLVYHSGRSVTVEEGILAPFGGSPSACFAASDAAALAAACLDRERPEPARLARGTRIEAFGATLPTPSLRLIVPLGETPDATRARAALVAGERRGAQVEVIFHGQDAQADAATDSMAEVAAVFGVPHRLVRLPRAAEALDGLKAALTLAEGAPALVLGQNVMPAGAGWLVPWLRRIDSPWAVLGGALLDHDGAVLHAGGALVAMGEGPVRRMEPHLGLPAADLPRATILRGTLMTCDCVGLAAASVTRLAGADETCPSGDAALALTVRRLAAEGAATGTFLRGHFVRYGGAARNSLAAAVEAHALGTLLKRSFSLGVQELLP